VLETARGGMLLKGMGISTNDVSVVTNVTADHLGLQGIDTLDQLAEVKAIVTTITKPGGWVVLNGDDPRVWPMRHRVRAQPWAFSLDPDAPALRESLPAGGRGITVLDGDIVVLTPGADPDRLAKVVDVPVTLSGLARHNIANALAGAAAALGLGMPRAAVVEGLRTFQPDPVLNEGRLNTYSVPAPEGGSATVILDMAHNEAGLEALLEVAHGLTAQGGRFHLGLGATGDRPDEAIQGLGELAGKGADHVVLAHKRKYLRGRTIEDIEGHLRAGLGRVGVVETESFDSETEGITAMMCSVGDGDVVALMCHEQRAEIAEWLHGLGATADDSRTIRRKVVAARGEHEAEGEIAALWATPDEGERIAMAERLRNAHPADPRLVFELASALDAAGRRSKPSRSTTLLWRAACANRTGTGRRSRRPRAIATSAGSTRPSTSSTRSTPFTPAVPPWPRCGPWPCSTPARCTRRWRTSSTRSWTMRRTRTARHTGAPCTGMPTRCGLARGAEPARGSVVPSATRRVDPSLRDNSAWYSSSNLLRFVGYSAAAGSWCWSSPTDVLLRRRTCADRLFLGLHTLRLRRHGELGRVEVGVAGDLARVGARLGVLGAVLELGKHLGVLVDTHHDQVAGVGPGHDVVDGIDLVEDHLDLAAPGSLGHGLPDAVGDEGGRLARPTATAAVVLADDDHVEVLGGDGSELAHVLVASVAGGADHADPRHVEVGAAVVLLGVALDELTDGAHAGRVVAVVDEDIDVVDVDEVHPAGREVVARREGAQALADVVQRRPGREGGAGRGEGVGDVEPRGAPEGRGKQVGPRELHAAPAVPDDDHVSAVGLLEDDRAPAAPAVLLDELTALAAGVLEGEPDDVAGAPAPHPADERVVGVEDGEPVAGDRLNDDGLDGCKLLDGVDAPQPEVVGGDVRDDRDVVAVVAQPLADDAAAGDLHDGEVDPGVLQDHPG